MNDFDFYLVFCADGVLRMKYSNSPMLVPVKALQEIEQIPEDYKFWFNWWNKSVGFEEGLTFGKFLECLLPWEIFWSNYAGIEIEAYVKEGRKLSLLKPEDIPFDWLMIRRHHNINNCYKFDDSLPFIDMWKPGVVPNLLPRWTINSSLKFSGYKQEIEDHFAISDYPANVLYNIPLYLNNTDIIEINDYWYEQQTDKQSILNRNGFGVNMLGKLPYLKGPSEFSLKDLLSEMFNEFELNPVEREYVKKDTMILLQEAMDEVEESIAEEGTPDKELLAIGSTTVDALKMQLESERNYWTEVTEKAKKLNTAPLKIGKITVGVEPVQFVYGTKVND